MFCSLLALIVLPTSEAQTQSPNLAKLRPVPFHHVKITDSFWSPRRETNQRVSLSHSLDMLEKSGNIEDFELAAAKKRSGYKGPVFMDSDLYKTLEAVSYSLATDPNPELGARIDGIIQKVAAAQMPDGYLNTYYQVNEPDRRFTNLADNHELYCAGHLFEAAVAHFRATGKKSLLNVATKFADYLAKTFGDGPNQRPGYCGHPEIELALVKLYDVTGTREYFRLAKFFVDHRGEKFFAREKNVPIDSYDGTYFQDNVPIRDHKSIVGHAVRAAYLMSGVVDVARDTNDLELLNMVQRVWTNTTRKNMYVTGGIGPSASNEGFTHDYDLPNATAYQETCASVAMVMWNHRLALLHGDSKYVDVMETSLYNGVLAGYSMDGKSYFYVNPLSSSGNHHRSEWFGCACCPPNVARTLSQLGGYAYAVSPNNFWVNLFIQGQVTTDMGGTPVTLDVKTNYPWEGKVQFKVTAPKPVSFRLNCRVPGWAPSHEMKLNGEPLKFAAGAGPGYIGPNRVWKSGDTFEVNFPVKARRIAANPMVKDNAGKLALARGPLVYCLEQVDQSVAVSSISVPPTSEWSEKPMDAFGGIVALETQGVTSHLGQWPGGLYTTAPDPTSVQVRAIPYYAWDNRDPGEMSVWLPTTPLPPKLAGLESNAKVEMSFVNTNSRPNGVKDGVEPKSSGEQPASLAHWWNHKGGTEWISYTWPSQIKVSGIQVYWFDDTGRGECKLPQKWHLEAKTDGDWVAVPGTYPISADKWCDVNFDAMKVTGLRIVVEMQPGWSAGIHEWRVWAPDESSP